MLLAFQPSEILLPRRSSILIIVTKQNVKSAVGNVLPPFSFKVPEFSQCKFNPERPGKWLFNHCIRELHKAGVLLCDVRVLWSVLEVGRLGIGFSSAGPRQNLLFCSNMAGGQKLLN